MKTIVRKLLVRPQRDFPEIWQKIHFAEQVRNSLYLSPGADKLDFYPVDFSEDFPISYTTFSQLITNTVIHRQVSSFSFYSTLGEIIPHRLQLHVSHHNDMAGWSLETKYQKKIPSFPRLIIF